MAALTEDQIQQLCDTFQHIDSNKDGFVDAAEIDQMLADTFPGVDPETQVAVRQLIMSEGDTNGDGRIDIGEFLALIARRQYDALMTAQGAGADGATGAAPEGEDPNAAPAAAAEDDANIEDPHVAAIMRELSAEEIDMYRDAFIRLDRDGDGFVGREEMMTVVGEHVGATRIGPLREYLDKIFDVADRDQDNMLSLTEFLGSFADGPGAVPQDTVVDLVASIRVRLTDDEIFALQESFRNIDKNNDGFIDAEELFAALKGLLLARSPDLSDQAFRDIVSMVLESADRDHDGRLNLAEFIRSFQEDQGVLPTAFIDGRAQRVARRLTKDEVEILKEAFKMLDSNNDGFIDYVELYTALSDTLASSGLSKDQVRDLVDLIMVTADRNKDGKLTLTEFISNFVANEDLMTIPVVSAEAKAVEASSRLQGMLQSGEVTRMAKVFDFLDANGDGFLDEGELGTVLGELLGERFPEWDAETLAKVKSAIIEGADTDHDGKISLQEFVQSFVSGAGVLPPEVVHEWGELLRRELNQDELNVVIDTFKTMDTNNDGVVSRDELSEALRGALAGLLEDEAHLQRVTDFVMEKVDSNQDGQVSLREFVESFEKGQGVLPVATASPEQEQEQEAPKQEQEEQQEAPKVQEPLPASPNTRPDRPDSPVGKQLGNSTYATEANPPPPPMDSNVVLTPSPAEEIPCLAASPLMTPTPGGTQLAREEDQSPNKNLDVETPARGTSIKEAKSPIVNDVSGVAISDGQLRAEFAKYDTDSRGWLDRNEFKKIYMTFEFFGMEPTPQDVDRLFARYSGGDSKISYDEFCILMLERSRM